MFRKNFDLGIILAQNNKTGYLAAGIIFTTIRIVGDIILLILDKISTVNLTLWNLTSTIAIVTAFLLYFFTKDNKSIIINNYDLSVEFLKDVNKFFILSASIFFGSIFVTLVTQVNYLPDNIFTLALQLCFSLFVLLTAMFLLQFLYKWFNIRKHKKTKFYLFIIAYIYFYFLIKFLIVNIIGLELDFLKFIDFIGYSSIIILGWMLVSKNNWVAILPRNLKIKQIWLTFFAFIFSIIVIHNTDNNTSELHILLHKYLPLSETVIILTYTLFSSMLLRLFFTTVATLPTTKIVERRTSEISSLTYLNKLVADSVDNNSDYLLDVVTKLALQSCNANSAWTETYENNSTKIVSSVNINRSALTSAHSLIELSSILINYQQSELIDSVEENQFLSNLSQFLPNVKSLIIIPLFSASDRIGTLLVGDSEEFAFERDDLNVLNAFGDNVRIAIENAKLVKDSIEKERYKNELLVAQKIQNKLLPQKLPDITNYSIAAFSIPATEVGGDYYDVVKLKNGNYCILIGDVSGKGFSAAFYMAQLKGIVMSVSNEAESPSDLLKKINKILYGNIEKQMYITMSALSINGFEGNISFSRAGHMPFFIKSGQFISTYIPKGIGLGLANDSIFNESLEEIELNLNSGDSILMFTDGVNELKSDNKEEFGYAPLMKSLTTINEPLAATITNNVMNEIHNYGNNISHSDDMTIFALIFKKEN